MDCCQRLLSNPLKLKQRVEGSWRQETRIKRIANILPLKRQEALDALLGLGWLLLVQTKGMKVLLLSQFWPMRALQNPANVISEEHGWAFSRHWEEEEEQRRTNGTVRL